MASASYVGSDNLVLTAALSANSSAAGLGPTRLAEDQGSPDAAWQTAAGVVTVAGGALMRADFALSGSTLQGFAITRTNLTPAAAVTFTVWDTSGPTLVYSSGALPGPVPRYGQVIHVAPAPVTGDFVQVTIDDPTNADGFLNVPLAYFGGLWNPAVGFSWESSHSRESLSARRRTAGGQLFSDLRYRARVFDLRLSGVTAAEWPTLDALDHDARADRNILVIPDAVFGNIQTTAVFGTLTPTAAVTYPYQAADARAWAARSEERL